MLDQFDRGPSKKLARMFGDHPDYAPEAKHFWYDWGPVYYRGRRLGGVKVLGLASDPGPTERIVGRALVGDAGQRVQGFLRKLGLTESYVLINVFNYALHPSHWRDGHRILAEPGHVEYRDRLIAELTGPELQAVVAFGGFAQHAVDLWDNPRNTPILKVHHPSFRTQSELLNSWREAIDQLRLIVTPDPGGDATEANYGSKFTEADYQAIPRIDLPFGTPTWVGDDAWGRSDSPRHNNCVSRPSPDDGHTLEWIAPKLGGT